MGLFLRYLNKYTTYILSIQRPPLEYVLKHQHHSKLATNFRSSVCCKLYLCENLQKYTYILINPSVLKDYLLEIKRMPTSSATVCCGNNIFVVVAQGMTIFEMVFTVL